MDINSAADVIVVGHGSSVVSGQAVYVHQKPRVDARREWTLAQTLTDDTANDFGFSVAIDKTDDTIVVGAKKTLLGSVSDVGAAFVFARTSSSWTQVEFFVPRSRRERTLLNSFLGRPSRSTAV